MDIVGLGSLAMDVLIQVDSLPREDGFCIVKHTEYLPGGSGTNVIVQASRLGANCGYIACLGDDSLGRDVLANLESEGVDVSAMVVKSGGVTLHTDIVVDQQGRKFILLNMGDCFMDLSADVELGLLNDTKVFYTDLFPYAPALAGLRRAKQLGLKTVFNMQAGLDTMQGMGITREMILECLAYVDVFTPCQLGLFGLSGSENIEISRDFVRRHFGGLLLVTLGASGSVAYTPDGGEIRVPARTIQPQDTTGAGDSYIGAFMVGYHLDKLTLPEAMQMATDCAAYTCCGLGARHSPTRGQLAAFRGGRP